MKHLYLKTFSLLGLLSLAPLGLLAQGILSGKILTLGGKPITGASVYLNNTLDGSTSDSTGAFTFPTTEKGAQTLVVSAAGYNDGGMPLTVNGNLTGLEVRLKASATNLNEVVVTAGSFEAGSGNGKTVLSSLDIVTTAGAQADIVRAIQTLPGTQQQGTQTGLFVRGGDASEASVIVDGLVVQNAFFSGAPGTATRSRFSPFQFKGISFSSGGYSARYGQALSSVLELNTLDLAEKSTVNLGVNMAGVYASGAKLWGDKVSVEATGNYNNLTPFYKLATTNFDFYDPPKGGGGSAKLAWKPNKDGILKVMGNIASFGSGTSVTDPGNPGQDLRFGLNNLNAYGTANYRQTIHSKWNIYAGGLYSYNRDNINWNDTALNNTDDRAQLRLEAKRYLAAKLNILVGTELQHFHYSREYGSYPTLEFSETQLAGYAEAEWSPVQWMALRPGLRYERSELLGTNTLSPRLNMGIKAGKNGQVSMAGGWFYQSPDVIYLQYGYRPKQQQAIHAIANYQWQTNTRTLRIEGYYKDYQSLVRERYMAPMYNPNSFRDYRNILVDNSGNGYAQGIELFWRDKKSIKNLDYWVSYSYIDTRRLYKNFVSKAQPDFIADHNLNIITKYWMDKLQTNVNATYSFATGRPYYNPNNPEFLGDRTAEYHNLSLAVNHLRTIGKWFTVIYAGVDNVTNHHNIFGYRYRSATDTNPVPQLPALYRSFFVGINFSLTEFDKDEL